MSCMRAEVTPGERAAIVAGAAEHPASDVAWWASETPRLRPTVVARVMREEGFEERLGLRWNERELEALREGMGDHPSPDDPHWAEALPGRDEMAVRQKMQAVRRDSKVGCGNCRWDAREEDLAWRVLSAMAERLGRTPKAVALRLVLLSRARSGEGER